MTVRRLLTDPATGVLTDLTDAAEKRYRPSAALDRAVRARDVTCRFPGCRRSADSPGTDLDHTVPWPAGPTAATNLAVLCRRHHRLKHTAGWNVHLHPTGVMTWTTPTGRHVTTPSPGSTPTPTHRVESDPCSGAVKCRRATGPGPDLGLPLRLQQGCRRSALRQRS